MHVAIILLLPTVLIAGLSIWAAFAQQPGSDDIVRALTPPKSATRGIQVIAPEQQRKPAIDLYINFKFDSADVEPEAMPVLRSLGTALRDPQLKEAKIMIIGHTDATGSDDYNMQLSQRRAEAVRKFLIATYGIDATRLVAVGHGERELKDPARPGDGINRRVEIRNVLDEQRTIPSRQEGTTGKNK